MKTQAEGTHKGNKVINKIHQNLQKIDSDVSKVNIVLMTSANLSKSNKSKEKKRKKYFKWFIIVIIVIVVSTILFFILM